MNIQHDVSLRSYLTMNLGGPARYVISVRTRADITEALAFCKQQQLPFYVIGGGSNIIARDEPYAGVIIHPAMTGFTVDHETDREATITIAAGEIWDSVVERTVAMGLQGIEAMSAIPGLAGAAPVQNVGAYGQEIADSFVRLEAVDTTTDQLVTMTKAACSFRYRDSIFRSQASGRYIITSITLTLRKAQPTPPFYAALQAYLDDHHITDYSLSVIRHAVTAIRASKLPDPQQQPNTGSFFKNALVPRHTRDELLARYPDMPSYDMPNAMAKIPTGWLIEQTGLKGQLLHGMRINPANALVLINESATSYQHLAAARQEIIAAVLQQFAIQIEQEPLELQSKT